MVQIILQFQDDKDGLEAIEAMKKKKRVYSDRDTKIADCKFNVDELKLVIEKKQTIIPYLRKGINL